MHDTVFQALQQGATLVTANQRLARHLRAEYGELHRAMRVTAWQAPDILPWPQWLERFWLESFGQLDGDAPQPLLNSFQEQTLWETIIHDLEASPLLQEPAAARDARAAWQLLHAWQLPLTRVSAYGNEDVNAFVRWARAYQQRCARERLLDSATLPEAVRRAMGAGRLKLPPQVLLAGFDEFTPQQTSLLQTVRNAGSRVVELATGVGSARAARVAFVDARAERRAAAAWTRAALEAGASRIGIVVPDLASVRTDLARELDEILIPQSLLPGAECVRPYNLSLGEPLARAPLVHAALTMLAAGQGSLPTSAASQLLRSPFIAGHAAEQAARARIDLDMRNAGEVMLTTQGLLLYVQDALTADRTAAPMLAAQLKAWRDVLPSGKQKKSPSSWSELFARLLQSIGWPGDGELDHDRMRTLDAWRELLAQLATLDSIAPRQTYEEALGLLRRMAFERIYQPPTPAAPVQVLGLLEAAGLEFDRLWIMGLDDDVWPPTPRPNPFLPNALQREHHLPQASAERELEFARRLTERLLRSAAEVVVSHVENAGDEQRRPSPLILSIPVLRTDDLPKAEVTLAARQLAASRMTRVADTRAPELPVGSRVTGGTSVLQHQAACPFRAFAENRLGTAAPEEPEAGLDARARGTLVHEALRYLWEALQSQARLIAMSESERATAIAAAIDKAIAHTARERSQTLRGRFREIEAQRLTSLLRAWLEVEIQRSPFTLLTAEKDSVLRLGGLEFRGRIDRIDTLADGSVAITDYKTGSPKTKSWDGDRPDEPQLPAYAVGREPPLPVSAVLFGQLKRGKGFGFKGVAATDGVARQVKPVDDWPTLLAGWRATLDRLADDFRRGDCRVDPKEFPQTCHFCGLMSLCRVHEQIVMPEESEGENGHG